MSENSIFNWTHRLDLFDTSAVSSLYTMKLRVHIQRERLRGGEDSEIRASAVLSAVLCAGCFFSVYLLPQL